MNNKIEEVKNRDAPSSLLKSLSKALFLLVARYAGIEQHKLAKRILTEELNAEEG